MRLFVLSLLIVLSPPARAGSIGLDLMLVGKEVVQIADTWQLTHAADGEVVYCGISPDGRQVALLTEMKDRKWNLCLVPSTGGTVKTAMTSDDDPGPYKGKPETWWSLGGYGPTWTADGRHILLTANAHSTNEHGSDRQCCLIVLTAKGDFVFLIPVPDGGYITSKPHVSPDGRLAVALSGTLRKESEEERFTLTVFDLANRTARNVPADAMCYSFMRFSPDGKFVLYYTDESHNTHEPGTKPSQTIKREINLDTGESRVAERLPGPASLVVPSPDGNLVTSESRFTISVKNEKTGASSVVVKSRAASVLNWAPNSRWFLYAEDRKLSDHANARESDDLILWLASPDSGKLNTLRIPGFVECLPSWSADGMKLAYVNRGRLHVLALKKRAPTPEEKLEAGLPLTEQDERHLIEDNANTLRSAISNWRDHNDGLLPPENYEDALFEVLSTYYDDYPPVNSPYCRPGTAENIFTYLPSNFERMQPGQESKTVIAELDAGYNWKVVIYADGMSRTVPR